MNTINSFLITTLAGLSTIIGIIPCFINSSKKENLIASSLAFSSGIMITISLISLIPEATTLLTNTYKQFPSFLICSIFVIVGILISTTIDEKIERKLNKSRLYKLGLITTITLILHNIPEGITTFLSSTTNEYLGIKLSLAIALHNIPEGISIAIPIYYSTKNKFKTFMYTLIAGFSETIGALLAYIFLKNIITPTILSITLAITAGIMISISVYEFLPESYSYKKNKATIYYFVLGILIMFLSEIFL